MAALMVLVSHLEHELAAQKMPAGLGFHDPTGIVWAAGVDVFFIVSGFIIYYLTSGSQRPDVGQFIKRRLIRVVPLYWIFLSAFLLVAILAGSLVREPTPTLPQIVSAYFFFPWPTANGDVMPVFRLGWTLNYEIFFYAIFALTLLLRRHTGLVAMVGIFISLSLAAPLFSPEQPQAWFYSRPIILEFLFGMGLCMAFLKGVRLGPWVRIFLIVAGLAGLALPNLLGWQPYLYRPLWAGLPALVIAAGLMLGPDLRGDAWSTRALVLGGDISYALYLSHMFTLRAMTVVWRELGLPGGWAYFIAGLIVALGGAWIAHRWLERPLLALMRRLFDSPRKQDTSEPSPEAGIGVQPPR